jgi:Protein of unknown function (DUF732)
MRRVLMLISVAAMIATAAPGNADIQGTDQAFLTALQQAGLTYQDPERAIAVGHTVCRLADEGMTGADLVKHLQEYNPGFEGDGAAKFTAIAASAYCPKSLNPGSQGSTPKPDGA